MLYSVAMSTKLLPEAVQTSPGDAIKLSAWAGVAVVVASLSRWWLLHHTDGSVVARAVIALAPIVPSLLWMWSITRWISQLDELQRRIQSEAWFLAAVGTVLVTTALNLVASAGVLQLTRLSNGLGWEGAFAVMFLLYCVGCVITNRRYR